jgi:hypothetical protein
MILDKQLEFSNSQAVTGNVVSTNVLDFTQTNPGLGAGKEMAVFLAIPEAPTLANADVTVTVQTDTVVGFGSPTTVIARTIPQAQLVAGAQFYISLPAEYNTEQFLRLSIAASTSNFLLDAYLIPQDHQNRYVAYPAAVTIS